MPVHATRKYEWVKLVFCDWGGYEEGDRGERQFAQKTLELMKKIACSSRWSSKMAYMCDERQCQADGQAALLLAKVSDLKMQLTPRDQA